MGQWAFQKENGTVVNHAWVHGYNFGDWLLEGVFFKVIISNSNQFKVVEVDGVSRKYFEQLNKDMWFERARLFAEKLDVFYEIPLGGDEITVVDTATGKTGVNWR